MDKQKEQTKLVKRAGQVTWHVGKGDGRVFSRARAFFVSGTKVVHGLEVPQQVWVTVFAYEDAAQVLAETRTGEDYLITGTWSARDGAGPVELTCFASGIAEAPELPAAMAPAVAGVNG